MCRQRTNFGTRTLFQNSTYWLLAGASPCTSVMMDLARSDRGRRTAVDGLGAASEYRQTGGPPFRQTIFQAARLEAGPAQSGHSFIREHAIWPAAGCSPLQVNAPA